MPVISFDVTVKEALQLRAAHDERLPARAGDTNEMKSERVGKYAKRCLFDVLRNEDLARATRDARDTVLSKYPTQSGFEDIAH